MTLTLSFMFKFIHQVCIFSKERFCSKFADYFLFIVDLFSLEFTGNWWLSSEDQKIFFKQKSNVPEKLFVIGNINIFLHLALN